MSSRANVGAATLGARSTESMALTLAAQRSREGWRGALARYRQARLSGVGSAIVLLALLVAITAPWISPYDPLQQNLDRSLEGPSRDHLLGTDDLGRDIAARVIYGARVSLAAGVVAVAIALLAGILLGLIAGYRGGQMDNWIMRLIDSVLSFPSLILALALAAVLGAGLRDVLIALGIVYTPTFARLARGQVLSLRHRDFVEAARLLGLRDGRILARHILPNILAPLIIQASLSVAFAILAEASLSFLGLGIQPPEPSWGSMVNAGRGYLQQDPWIVFGPGGAIFITVMGFNFVGDAVRDALDPRLKVT